MEASVKSRQSNIEILRIVAMLLIISHHYAVHGVIHLLYGDAYTAFESGTLINKLFTILLIPGGKVGVAIFFMITGFFQIKRDGYSLMKVIRISVFYSVASIIVVVAILSLGNFTDIYSAMPFGSKLSSIAMQLLPVNGAWWFIAVYVILMIMSPEINRLIKSSGQDSLRKIIMLGCGVYAISEFAGFSLYTLYEGILFYVIGAYYGLQERRSCSKAIYAFLSVLGWLAFCYTEYIKISLRGDPSRSAVIMTRGMVALQTGALAVLISVCLFRLFSNTNIKSNKFINQIGSTEVVNKK